MKSAGTARWAWNQGLQRKKEAYESGNKTPSSVDLGKALVLLKDDPKYAWLYAVSSCIITEALRNLDKAYKAFFRRIKQGTTPGFPKFKARHKGIGSFQTQRCLSNGSHVYIPKAGFEIGRAHV